MCHLDEPALRDLITSINEPSGFDSEYMVGMIGLALVRATTSRDRPHSDQHRQGC